MVANVKHLQVFLTLNIHLLLTVISNISTAINRFRFRLPLPHSRYLSDFYFNPNEKNLLCS